jgi:hypothetical protein
MTTVDARSEFASTAADLTFGPHADDAKGRPAQSRLVDLAGPTGAHHVLC